MGSQPLVCGWMVVCRTLPGGLQDQTLNASLDGEPLQPQPPVRADHAVSCPPFTPPFTSYSASDWPACHQSGDQPYQTTLHPLLCSLRAWREWSAVHISNLLSRKWGLQDQHLKKGQNRVCFRHCLLHLGWLEEMCLQTCLGVAESIFGSCARSSSSKLAGIQRI